MAKAMKDFLYHFGLKLRIYPDYQQRKIIKINSDASRFVYNEMVYINLELWKFGNPKIYIKGVSEWRAKKDKRPIISARNLQKQRQLVAELQSRVMKRRDAFQHILSVALIKNHDLVAAEELRSKNLLKNHALAMSISEAGWRSFLSKLEYKAKLYGKIFITVDQKNTTQTDLNGFGN